MIRKIWAYFAGMFGKRKPAPAPVDHVLNKTITPPPFFADMVMPHRNRHTGSAYFQPTHSQKVKNKRRRAQFS